jgi:hypothetical protein
VKEATSGASGGAGEQSLGGLWWES